MFQQYLTTVQPYLNEYGYTALFLVVFFESFGVPLPGETMVITAALLASRGELHIIPTLTAVWIAAVLGDNVGYLIGTFGGRRLVIRYGLRLGITDRRLARVEEFFGRYGVEVVLIARFFLLLRQLNGVAAGIAVMPWRRFVIYNLVGGALWTGVWGLGVYLLGQDIITALPWISRYGYVAFGLIGVAVLAALIVWFIRNQWQAK